jgi:diguanylate cyclase (GGDEF)-like protein
LVVGQWHDQTPTLAQHLGPFGLHLQEVAVEDFAEAIEQPGVAIVMVDQDLVSQIRRPLGSTLPILAIGHHESLHDRIALVRAGVNALISPPLDAFDVVDALDRYRMAVDSKPIKVVLVDDDPALVSLLEFQLSSAGMDVTALSGPDDLLDVLASVQPEVLVLDRNMPLWDGFDVAMVVRQVPAYSDLPLVFLTADQRPDSRLTALALGGDDYLHKPVDGVHLATLVRARALRARALRQKIVTDGLTGLLNHMALVHEAQHHCALARRLKRPLSVALIDIDHFKTVNDTYGHQVGDSVLRGMSRMLRQRLRRSDLIGRMGGEEFAVIMPDTSPQQAVEVIEALRIAFGQLEFSAKETAFQVTFSAGVAGARICDLACPSNAEGEKSLICDDVTGQIRRADEALYEAKHHGRNRTCLSQP